MKFLALFSFLLISNLALLANAQDQATPSEVQSNTITKAEAPPAPNLFFSYSYYHYDMQGHDAANTNIYKFGASTVDLNLLTATWLYSPNWTLLVLVPYISNRVETIYEPTPAGANFKTIDTTSGLGDVRFMAITPVILNPAYMTLLDIGFTAPTGSTNRYFTSVSTQRAAYNMQPGSGTPDLVLGATVNNSTGALASSARAQATFRGGYNEHGYALGDEYLAKLSSLCTVTSYLTAGVIGNYRYRGAVQGRDEKYELHNDYHSFFTDIAGDGHQFYHAPQQNWDADAVVKLQTPSYKNLNAGFEFGVPFAQGSENKDDVDLNIKYYASASLNASF